MMVVERWLIETGSKIFSLLTAANRRSGVDEYDLGLLFFLSMLGVSWLLSALNPIMKVDADLTLKIIALGFSFGFIAKRYRTPGC